MNQSFDDIIKQRLQDLAVHVPADAWNAMLEQIEANPDLLADATTFDEIVGAKLVETDVPPMNWDRMEQMIEEEGLVEHPNDQLIKDTLTDLSIPLAAGAWAAFETELDLAESGINELFQEQLDTVEIPYDANSWELLEAKMDLEANIQEMETENNPIDQVAYNKLRNLEAPQHTANWAQFKRKLDIELSFRKRLLYRYRLAEVALLLLLIWTMFNVIPAHKELLQDTLSIVIPKTTIEETTPTKNNTTSDIASTKDLASIVTNTTNNTEDNSGIDSSIDIADNTLSGTNLTPSLNFDLPILPVSSSTTQNNTNPIETTKLTALVVQDENEEAKLTPESGLNYFKSEIGLGLYNTTLFYLPYLKTNYLLNQQEEDISSKTNFFSKIFTPLQIRMSMLSKADYVYIMTPHDRIFDKASYNNTAFGYGMGFTLGLGYGRWEVETGAIYSAFRYEPNSITEIIGDFELGYVNYTLQDIQLDILQVPLNINYQFKDTEKWDFYASTGATMSVVLQNTHNFDSDYAARPSSTTDRSTEGNSLGEIINENSVFNNKISSDGWLKGGSYLQNRYFTANLGLGVERRLGRKWSVFMQNTYQHTLTSNGYGINKDRFNTISILAGAKIKLK